MQAKRISVRTLERVDGRCITAFVPQTPEVEGKQSCKAVINDCWYEKLFWLKKSDLLYRLL